MNEMRGTTICGKIETAMHEHGCFNELCSALWRKLWAAQPGASDGETLSFQCLVLTRLVYNGIMLLSTKRLLNSLPDGLAHILASHPVAAPYELLC
ncbi:MAG: hypothetical protein ABI700_16325 [Chloroflexota bacterium]